MQHISLSHTQTTLFILLSASVPPDFHVRGFIPSPHFGWQCHAADHQAFSFLFIFFLILSKPSHSEVTHSLIWSSRDFYVTLPNESASALAHLTDLDVLSDLQPHVFRVRGVWKLHLKLTFLCSRSLAFSQRKHVPRLSLWLQWFLSWVWLGGREDEVTQWCFSVPQWQHTFVFCPSKTYTEKCYTFKFQNNFPLTNWPTNSFLFTV